MGQDEDFGIAYAKTQMAAKPSLPLEGSVFLSVKDSDKTKALEVARGLSSLGFSFILPKVRLDFSSKMGSRPKAFTHKRRTPQCRRFDQERKDPACDQHSSWAHSEARRKRYQERSRSARRSGHHHLGSAFAALDGIRSLKDRKFSVKALQDYRK